MQKSYAGDNINNKKLSSSEDLVKLIGDVKQFKPYYIIEELLVADNIYAFVKAMKDSGLDVKITRNQFLMNGSVLGIVYYQEYHKSYLSLIGVEEGKLTFKPMRLE